MQKDGIIGKVCDLIVNALPDGVTGKRDILENVYISRFGQYEGRKRAAERKKEVARNYLITAAAGALMICISLYAGEGASHIDKLTRPETGGRAEDVSVRVYSDNEEYAPVSEILKINARALTDEEEARVLEDFMDGIEEKILGDNTSVSSVSEDLDLFEYDEETGIRLRWSSDSPEVISGDGTVNVSYCTDGAVSVYLNVTGTLGDAECEKETEVNVVRNDALLEKGIRRQLNEVISEINGSDEGDEVILPEMLKTGEKLIWEKNSERKTGAVVLIVMMAVIFVRKSAVSKPKKESKEYIRSIKNDFPSFIDKLVLLLNAGMVVSAALDKIASDHEKTEHKRPLSNEIVRMQKDMRESNISRLEGWRELGTRTGLSEIMRFSAVLNDNISKGSSLAEKLEAEAVLMRRVRRNDAEERGHAAETKMTLPMVISLGALVVITIAPSVMEF